MRNNEKIMHPQAFLINPGCIVCENCGSVVVDTRAPDFDCWNCRFVWTNHAAPEGIGSEADEPQGA